MRRFRVKWLRKNAVPKDLEDFWIGHAKGTISDAYSKLEDDLDFRREVAQKAGLGFELPAEYYGLIPVRPNEEEPKEAAIDKQMLYNA